MKCPYYWTALLLIVKRSQGSQLLGGLSSNFCLRVQFTAVSHSINCKSRFITFGMEGTHSSRFNSAPMKHFLRSPLLPILHVLKHPFKSTKSITSSKSIKSVYFHFLLPSLILLMMVPSFQTSCLISKYPRGCHWHTRDDQTFWVPFQDLIWPSLLFSNDSLNIWREGSGGKVSVSKTFLTHSFWEWDQ